jgi:hypothetical protein
LKNFRRLVRTLVLVSMLCIPALAEEAPVKWRQVESRVDAGAPTLIFVELERTPGRPAFKIETVLEATPRAAAITLMQEMLKETDLPDGHQRRVLERTDREALVYTHIDLPLMLADRELALRIVYSDDHATGIHRVDWREANDALPEDAGPAIRLSGTWGYWEFQPDGEQRTRATHVTQTELGGSIPLIIGDRLMKAQALESVSRLRGQLENQQRTAVAAGLPPAHE